MAMRITISGDRTPFAGWQWRAAAGRWAAEVEPLALEALRSRAPVAPVNGGRLRDSIRPSRHVTGSSVRLEYGTSTPYAPYVLHGTQAHIIRARNARSLRWVQAGENRFAKQVRHPGTRPNPFPERAIRPLMPFIQQRFAAVVRSQIRP